MQVLLSDLPIRAGCARDPFQRRAVGGHGFLEVRCPALALAQYLERAADM